jgi:hypothetical protein
MPIYQPYDFLRLSADEETRLTKQIQDHRDEAMQARADWPVRHAERYQRYLADPVLRPPGSWEGSARLFIPTTRAVLERLQDEIWQALFATPLQIRAIPFGPEDIEHAQRVSDFLQWTVEKTLNWNQVTTTLVFDALLDSVGVAKVAAWEPPWPAPSTRQERFLRRQVRIDAVDLGMLLVAPDAEGLQYPECRYVAQELFLNADDLWRMEKRGYDVPDYDELGDAQQMTERKQMELEREGERVVAFKPDSVLFLESYERFTLNDEIGDEDIIVSWFPDAQIAGTSHNTAANQGRIAGVRRLTDVFPQDDRPRRPFFPVTFWGQPRQWRGLNVPDRLESMQDLINRLHEQLVNYGEVSMLPFVFVNTFLTGDIPDLRTVRPGTTVPIDDLSGVQFAPTRSLNRHFAEQIQMMQANVERDSHVTDFNLGRQGQGATVPRTASATMALLAQSRKSFGKLVRDAAHQFGEILTFHFRLWQEILPDDTYAGISRQAQAQGSALWDRLFANPSTNAPIVPPEPRLAAPISREQISGFFDVTIDVNPEEQFDQQVLTALFQLTAPALMDYPMGMRTMLKRIWAIYHQQGFDDIYPEEIAMLQTQQRLTAIQVQLATFEGQLAQLDQAQAQQQLQELQAVGQQAASQIGLSPEQAAAMLQGAPAQNGTTVPLEGS